jgi:hypothetical protein
MLRSGRAVGCDAHLRHRCRRPTSEGSAHRTVGKRTRGVWESDNSAVAAELSEHEHKRTERPVVEMALVVEIARLTAVGREALIARSCDGNRPRSSLILRVSRAMFGVSIQTKPPGRSSLRTARSDSTDRCRHQARAPWHWPEARVVGRAALPRIGHRGNACGKGHSEPPRWLLPVVVASKRPALSLLHGRSGRDVDTSSRLRREGCQTEPGCRNQLAFFG